MSTEAPTPPIAPGEILAGKYRIERVLGAGGMGVVVAARHLQLDQLVAVKFVLPSAAKDAVATERFLRESKLAVKLKSEHVAKVLDVGTLATGAPYMVMEYLEGTNLTELPGREGPLPVETAVGLVLQACEALAEAHSLGIVHRDLKPHNLFVTTGVGGVPLLKVLDFGISKILDAGNAPHLTQTSTVMGSPTYMAPEQMRSSRDVDARADVWALGVVLYELLVGHPPFEGDTVAGLALKIAQDTPAPLGDARPDVSAELSAIVARCLEKNRTERFADAGALGLALEPLCGRFSRSSLKRSALMSTLLSSSASRASSGNGASASNPRAGSPPEAAATKPETGAPWSGHRATSEVGETGPSKGVWIATLATLAVFFTLVGSRVLSHSSSTDKPKSPSSAAEPPAAEPAAPAVLPPAAPEPEPAKAGESPAASVEAPRAPESPAASVEAPRAPDGPSPTVAPVPAPAAQTPAGQALHAAPGPTPDPFHDGAHKSARKRNAGPTASSAQRGDDDIPSFR